MIASPASTGVRTAASRNAGRRGIRRRRVAEMGLLALAFGMAWAALAGPTALLSR